MQRAGRSSPNATPSEMIMTTRRRLRLSTLSGLLLALVAMPLMAQGNSRYHGAGRDRIVGEYIVVFVDSEPPGNADNDARDIAHSNPDIQLVKTWHSAVKGFFARMNEHRALALLNDPRIAYVEEN